MSYNFALCYNRFKARFAKFFNSKPNAQDELRQKIEKAIREGDIGPSRPVIAFYRTKA